MKTLAVKVVVVGVAALICGSGAGLLFSLWYYGLIPEDWIADVLDSDTHAKMAFRFWAAFIVGAIFGGVWVWRVVKNIKF
jgi:hypothetical protein